MSFYNQRMSEKPTPEELQQTIDSMSLIVRLVIFSQMAFGWSCLLVSIMLYFTGVDVYVLVLAFALIAATLPFIARVAVYELQRTILDYKRALPDAEADQLDGQFTQMRSQRRMWIRGLAGAFLLSVVLAMGAVLLAENSPLVNLPSLLLWVLGGSAMYFFTRDALDLRQK